MIAKRLVVTGSGPQRGHDDCSIAHAPLDARRKRWRCRGKVPSVFASLRGLFLHSGQLADGGDAAQGGRGTQDTFQRRAAEVRLRLLRPPQPVDLAAVRGKVIAGPAVAHQPRRCRLVRRRFEKGDHQAEGGGRLARVKRPVVGDGDHLVGRAQERGDFVAQYRLQVGLNALFQRRAGRIGIEEDIAAGDVGGDVAQPEVGKVAAQHVHLDRVTANVDGAKQGDDAWHGYDPVIRDAMWSAM